MIDERIKYWSQGWPAMNFGDFLSEYIHENALLTPLFEADRYRLIGSAIDSSVLQEDLRQCAAVHTPTIALWGCGKRDAEPLDAELMSHCHFFGVRGPLSRDALALPGDTPLGDPAFIVPVLRPAAAKRTAGTLCVPHFNEPTPPDLLLERCGAEEMASPAVAGFESLNHLLDQIASAEFVLAGSLHAAIVACAYEVPFGFWDTGFIDVPFKWQDFAASIGVEMPFFSAVADAQAHHAAVADRIRRPLASAILAHCPFGVRGSVLAAAWCQNAGLDETTTDALRAAATAGLSEARRATELQRYNASRRAHQRERSAGGDRGLTVESGRYLSAVADRLGRAAHAIEADVRAAAFIFAPEGADLTFSVGSAGAAFLRSGWTPPNEVGPWAVERYASVEIPLATRWWAWSRLDLGLIAFAPHQGPLAGLRRIKISANDMKLGDFVVNNQGSGHTVFETLSISLPQVLTRRGGNLLIVFESSILVSALALGISSDDRTLSFAPTYLKAIRE